MNKNELANALCILLNTIGEEANLAKLSIPTLTKIYDGLNQNIMAYALAQQEERKAKNTVKILESRCASLEKELKRK